MPSVNNAIGGTQDRPRALPSVAIEFSEKISGNPHGVKIIVTPDTNANTTPTESTVTLVVPTAKP